MEIFTHLEAIIQGKNFYPETLHVLDLGGAKKKKEKTKKKVVKPKKGLTKPKKRSVVKSGHVAYNDNDEIEITPTQNHLQDSFPDDSDTSSVLSVDSNDNDDWSSPDCPCQRGGSIWDSYDFEPGCVKHVPGCGKNVTGDLLSQKGNTQPGERNTQHMTGGGQHVSPNHLGVASGAGDVSPITGVVTGNPRHVVSRPEDSARRFSPGQVISKSGHVVSNTGGATGQHLDVTYDDETGYEDLLCYEENIYGGTKSKTVKTQTQMTPPVFTRKHLLPIFFPQGRQPNRRITRDEPLYTNYPLLKIDRPQHVVVGTLVDLNTLRFSEDQFKKPGVITSAMVKEKLKEPFAVACFFLTEALPPVTGVIKDYNLGKKNVVLATWNLKPNIQVFKEDFDKAKLESKNVYDRDMVVAHTIYGYTFLIVPNNNQFITGLEVKLLDFAKNSISSFQEVNLKDSGMELTNFTFSTYFNKVIYPLLTKFKC